MGVESQLNSLMIGLKEVLDIILILGAVILVIIILQIIESGLRAKMELKKRDRNIFYRKEIQRIKELDLSPDKMLERINITSRAFFKEAFNFPYHLEYLELFDNFKLQGKTECADFCKLISDLNYSGDEITKDDIDGLLSLLEKIIVENKIFTEEEKLKLNAAPVKIAEKQEKPENQKNDALEKETENLNIPNKVQGFSLQHEEKNPEIKKLVFTSQKRKDINHISLKYKFKIFMLRLRGKLPEIKKRKLVVQEPVSGVDQDIVPKLERQEPVSGVDQDIVKDEEDSSSQDEVTGNIN